MQVHVSENKTGLGANILRSKKIIPFAKPSLLDPRVELDWSIGNALSTGKDEIIKSVPTKV